MKSHKLGWDLEIETVWNDFTQDSKVQECLRILLLLKKKKIWHTLYQILYAVDTLKPLTRKTLYHIPEHFLCTLQPKQNNVQCCRDLIMSELFGYQFLAPEAPFAVCFSLLSFAYALGRLSGSVDSKLRKTTQNESQSQPVRARLSQIKTKV